MMKKTIFVVFLLLFTFGCRQDESEIVLKLCHSLPTIHPVHRAIESFAERVYEKSGGRIRVDVYPNGQLCDERTCTELVQIGALSMTKMNTNPLEPFSPQMRVLNLPYIYEDDEHKWKVLNGPIGQKLLDSTRPSLFKGLVYYDSGARSFYASKPILKPDDLKGMKIRVQKTPISIELIETLGGLPTPVSWGEIYSALQANVVDGAENNIPSYYSNNHYEVAKHYSFDEHTAPADLLIFSTKIWDKLSPEDQEIITEAARESSDFQVKEWKEEKKRNIEELKKKGIKFHYPDKKLFYEKVKVMFEGYDGTEVGKMLDEIEALRRK